VVLGGACPVGPTGKGGRKQLGERLGDCLVGNEGWAAWTPEEGGGAEREGVGGGRDTAAAPWYRPRWEALGIAWFMKVTAPRKSRSHDGKSRIIGAALSTIAEEGIARLTHRRLAERADVSLALTTYYFPKKADIVSAVSERAMQGYLKGFEDARRRYELGQSKPSDLWEFACRVVRANVCRHREKTMAWAEIYLNGVRNPESRVLTHKWVQELSRIWGEIAEIVDPQGEDTDIRNSIDLAVGATFLGLALGLDDSEIESLFLATEPSSNIDHLLQPPARRLGSQPLPLDDSLKKSQILEEAVKIVVFEGAGALNFRKLARTIGLAASGPSYYFSSLSKLMSAVQNAIFEASQERYRTTKTGVYEVDCSVEHVADVFSFVLQTEVQSFANENLALYQFWISAARDDEIRPNVLASVQDQTSAWNRVFDQAFKENDQRLGLMAQVTFIGKLIRILSSGGAPLDLIAARREFKAAFLMIPRNLERL